jgi:hypothetical protein
MKKGTLLQQIRDKIRDAIPRRILVGTIYPIIAAFHRFRHETLAAGLERLQLTGEALGSKLRLRSSRAATNAVGQIDSDWERRIADAVECPDNDRIPRCADAGELSGSCITMHNGIRIRALSYYGAGILNLLIKNKGVHEPQEELAFQEVLTCLPPCAVMIELGAYWGFYSLWFASAVKNPTCYLIEPDPRNIESGKQNFKLNGKKGVFYKAAAGDLATTLLRTGRLITLDAFCKRQQLSRIDILHADIQGAELAMLKGASSLLSERKIDYIFISSHSNSLHYECLDYLTKYGYVVLCSADCDQTYSYDGLLVVKRGNLEHPEKISIALKKSDLRREQGG